VTLPSAIRISTGLTSVGNANSGLTISIGGMSCESLDRR
jgi:hypothetical protein